MPDDQPANGGSAGSAKATLCVRCEHLCDPGLDRCDQCGAHLFIICTHCAHKNARVLSRCEKCRRRLHKTVKDRVRTSRSGAMNLVYIGAAVLVVIVATVLVIWLADIPMPRLW